ncbi:hypothetical protein OC846_000803 [Tilletia horrida]|uniref:Uncharacterized protein n=1 Tax=Tilletia horrida TaxID=155126 RepID=A0AAN6K0J8_9BASI|nr:hypothetical protein OC845_002355 [Tilletia horrida]KAK0556959.1 hypothetical protein OC846_000803 [Tilletia horrida]KAK0567805.1 hypothetical protein OC861_002474 [Tilletia horrida]
MLITSTAISVEPMPTLDDAVRVPPTSYGRKAPLTSAVVLVEGTAVRIQTGTDQRVRFRVGPQRMVIERQIVGLYMIIRPNNKVIKTGDVMVEVEGGEVGVDYHPEIRYAQPDQIETFVPATVFEGDVCSAQTAFLQELRDLTEQIKTPARFMAIASWVVENCQYAQGSSKSDPKRSLKTATVKVYREDGRVIEIQLNVGDEIHVYTHKVRTLRTISGITWDTVGETGARFWLNITTYVAAIPLVRLPIIQDPPRL